MANEQINIDILINASKSAKTLKEQRKALEDLKEGLDQVKHGSGAFELLTEEVDNLTNSMGNLNLRFEDVYGDIQPLTGRIGELEDRMYELALAGKQNTKEFTDLQSELITMRRAVRDVDDQVDSFVERGRGITQVTGAVQGLVATFNIAQGAMALFGDENEQLEKTLVKLNAGMAVLQGLQELSNQLTTKGTILNKAFNLVLKANPVFLLVTVITAVIGVWKLWNSLIDDSVEKQKELNQQLEEFKQLQQDNLAITQQVSEYNLAIAELEGKSVQELYDLKLALLQAEEDNAKDTYQANLKRIQDLRNVKDEDLIEERKKLETENKELFDKLKLDETFLNSFGKKRVLLEKQLNKEILENQKETDEKRKESIKEINDLIKKQIELQNNISEQLGSSKDYDELSKTLNQIAKSYKDVGTEIQQVYIDNRLTLIDNLEKGLITEKEFTLKSQENFKEYRKSFRLNYGLFLENYNSISKQIDDTEKRRNLESTKSLLDIFDYNSNLLEQERVKFNKLQDEKLQKEGITYGEIRRIESERFNLINQNIDEEIKLREQGLEWKKTFIDKEYQYELSILNERRLNNRNLAEEEEYQRNELLNIIKENSDTLAKEDIERYKLQVDALNKSIRLRQEIDKKLAQDEKDLAFDVAKEKREIEIKTNEEIIKLNEERVEATISSWEYLKQYIKDNPLQTVEAFSQVFSSTLQAIDGFLTSYEERRISFIQQETDLKLQAIDAEKEAYLNSINQQTNAEKFKAMKLKEFEDKKAIEEKKRDKEIAEAQYKGEIRKWEYSYLEAIVNLGKSLLGAAANPFQLAVVSALGVTQLATIQANKPTPPEFGQGGMITGPSHNGGGVDINAEGGEVIINKKSSQAFLPMLDMINQAYGGSPLMGKKVMATGGIVGGNTTIDTSNLERIVSQMVNKPIKTYVVSSDMTQQQNSDKVLKNRTSF